MILKRPPREWLGLLRLYRIWVKKLTLHCHYLVYVYLSDKKALINNKTYLIN